MSRLVIVSNRVSAPDSETAGSAGGLAMALSAAIRRANGIWFGWSGESIPTYTGEVHVQDRAGVTVATVDLDSQDVEEYYNGYANSLLWPLFHYRTDLGGYERAFGEGYLRANVRFAQALHGLLRPDDLIWVHDYHLIPLARELRALGVTNRIGFFLHIPWPPRRLLTTLPGHRALVEALFDYDLVGFQTEDHLEAFCDYVRSEAEGLIDAQSAHAFGREIQIGAFPIGLDAAEFVAASRGPEALEMYERMVVSRAGRRMIVGVDRLDYSKGLEERFLAYEQFLADSPAAHEDVFYLQIATPSREQVDAYQTIRARLDSISGRVNGAYSTVEWVPIRYVNRTYARSHLAGVYRAAAVGLITPLRDGMNLVAKEYVAAQDAADPGVLILSDFAGAASQLRQALIVNPYSREEVADSIRRALQMPLSERRSRWEQLMDQVTVNDVTRWRDAFVARLSASAPARAHRPPRAVHAAAR
jgi:trehalose 6-phosphate synthase